MKDKLSQINDGMLHEFIILKKQLIIQTDCFTHFEDTNEASVHGYLELDNGKLIDDGSNLPEGDLSKFHGEIILV